MLDEDDPTNSSVTAEIPLSSLDTLWEKRDNHLRSPDFFDADVGVGDADPAAVEDDHQCAPALDMLTPLVRRS